MDVQIPCICPPKDGEPRHEQDTVTLPEALDFRRTLVVRQSIALGMAVEGMDLAETTALLIESYLLHCIDAWTVVDDAGKPVPVTKQAVRDLLLVNFDEAEKVGDAADGLYTDKVVLPLLTRASSSSAGTSTPESTSRPNGRGTKRRTPSKPSSITTTPMAVTGPMAASPAGVSS